jgi:formylglycine-generating enzyme required for sulfatase activity
VKTAARLDHPNIVTAYDAGEDGGVHYLVMEFVDGHDLSRHVKEHGPLSAEQAADCAIQAAQGLGYAHQQGITHRDIKPANLLIDASGTVKILDMGLARLQEADVPDDLQPPPDASSLDTEINVDLTRTGSVQGTVAFMAPEQREDSKRVDHRADVYGLGGTLYYLLIGQPLRGLEKGEENGVAIEDRVAASLRRDRPDVPPSLAAVIRKMLARRPEGRPQSMGEVIDALRLALTDKSTVRPISAKRHKRWALWATGVTIALIVAGWIVYEARGSWQVAAIQQRLLDAATVDVPRVVSELGPYRRLADPRLKAALENAKANKDSRVQLRVSLALLPTDSGQVAYLHKRLFDAEPDELPVIRDALFGYRGELAERLWAVARDTNQDPDRRFRAACTLATYDPRDPRWSQVADNVAARLMTESRGALAYWIECLSPVRDKLKAPLLTLFRRRDESNGSQRVLLAWLLARFFADEPELLTDLLMDADEQQFADLYPALSTHRERAVSLLETELDKPLPPEYDEKEAAAKRRANAGVALVKLGQSEEAWCLLKHSPDPTVRSYLTHRIGPLGADPGVLSGRLRDETDVSVRRALILALGGFPVDRLSSGLRDSLIQDLLSLYREDPDPGIHGAAEWLLRRWTQDAKLAEAGLSSSSPGESGWYVNSEGQTMVVIPGPVEFPMGSPRTEPGSRPGERLHRRSIARTFAIGAKEVTVAEFQRFLRENPDFRRPETTDPNAEPDHPQEHVSWQDAIGYCRWLSRKEGIPEDEMCYLAAPASAGQLELPGDYLDRSGYRLPNEAEWEYACRAGSRTSRYFGDTEELLDEYAWISRGKEVGQTRPVGLEKPNDFGLFDMYGNVREWCHHTDDEDRSHGAVTAPGSTVSTFPARFRLRGASHRSRRESARSAHRFKHERHGTSFGFRVARNLPTTSLRMIRRSRTAWDEAEFLVDGSEAPFVIRDVRGDVEVLPRQGTTPAWIRVSARDRQTRPFSFVVQRTDTGETATARGILFSADWEVKFYRWSRTGPDELNPPADWEEVVAGEPLAVQRITQVDLEWNSRAPLEGVPPDHFAAVATTKLELPAGKYELWAGADDGVRVFVDGVKRMDVHMHVPLPERTSNLIEVRLDGGEHSFRLEHYEVNGLAELHFDIRPLKF